MTPTAPTRRPTWHNAFDAQMGLWRWLRTDAGQRYLYRDFQLNARGLNAGTTELLRQLYQMEPDKLLSGDPFFVSAEMCDVVGAAQESFQPEPLLPTDLLTPNGFIHFERPFVVPSRFDEEVDIAAISWTPILNADSDDDPGGFASIPKDGVMEHLKERNDIEGRDGTDGIALTLYSRGEKARKMRPDLSIPPILPFHVTPWWFSMSFDGNEVDENGKPTGAAWWWKIAQTTFRLMQQQITARHPERLDRPTRREAVRRGFGDREVVVVRLRREKGQEHDEPTSEANYSHRFIVSGHWRNQWYPASSVHRQIWISPYVKGPEDQPLVIRPRRVFTWSR